MSERELRIAIGEYFNGEELRTLSFEFGLDYDDDLVGQTKDAKILSFVQYCYRRNLLERLIIALTRERPAVNWQELIDIPGSSMEGAPSQDKVHLFLVWFRQNRYARPLLAILVLLSISGLVWKVMQGQNGNIPTPPTSAPSPRDANTAGLTTAAPFQVNSQPMNQPAPDVVVRQMLVSRSDSHYRVEVTIKNPRDQEELITRVKLFGHPGWHCNSFPVIYTISDTINIQGKEGESFQAEGEISQEGSNFRYPLEGRFEVGACGELTFDFTFDTHVILPAGEHTDFYLEIPRNLNAVVTEALFPDTPPADIHLSELLERYFEIGVEFSLDDQDRSVTYTLENSPQLSRTPSVIQAKQPAHYPVVAPSKNVPVPPVDLRGWTAYQNQNFVTDIEAANDGNLWAGGQEGVLRFDPNSNSLTTYTTLDGLPSNAITSVAAARDGSVWFGTESNGVLRFDGGSWFNYTKDHGLASNSITDVAAAPDGTLWLATQDAGIVRFDGSSWQVYNTESGLLGNNVGKIDVDEYGRVWFTPGDVSEYWFIPGDISENPYFLGMFDGETWNSYGSDHGLRVNEITAQNDSVWLATDYGAWRFANDEWTRYSRNEGLVNNSINEVLVAQDNSVWFASDAGVSKFDGSDWFTYDMTSGLVNQHVRAITGSSTGEIWLGTHGSGITRSKAQQWESYATPDCLPPGQLVENPIAVADRLLWMQLANPSRFVNNPGNDILLRFEDQTCATYGLADLVPDNSRLDSFRSKLITNDLGQVWYGTRSGLFQFELDKWKKVVDANYYEDVLANNDGGVWYSTFRDVKKFDGTQWTDLGVEHIRTLINTPTGVLGVDWPGGPSPVLHLYDFAKQQPYEFSVNSSGSQDDRFYAVSDEGDVWFSFGGIVYRYRDAALEDYTTNDGIISEEISSMAAGTNNTLWVGTTAGASHFDGEKWKNFTTSEGLIDNQIQTIAVDRSGWVWLGTPNGVSVFDGTTWKNFTAHNSGLAGNNVLEIFIAPKGKSIWFHTTSGFSIYESFKP